MTAKEQLLKAIEQVPFADHRNIFADPSDSAFLLDILRRHPF